MSILDWFRKKPQGADAPASAPPAASPAPATDRQAWQDALLAFVRERHAARPMPTEADLSGLEREEFRIEGGFLGTWLREYGPRMLAERRMLLEGMGRASPQPLVVLHGDVPAVAAVLRLAGDHARTGEKRLVTLLDEDYRAFLKEHREAREFDFHIESWSRFVPAAASLLDRARQLGKPIDPAKTYLNHVNGTLWGPHNGLEVENLWSWDGQSLELIEEGITHKRY